MLSFDLIAADRRNILMTLTIVGFFQQRKELKSLIMESCCEKGKPYVSSVPSVLESSALGDLHKNLKGLIP